MMKMAIAQINPILGDTRHNLQLIQTALEKSEKKDVDLVIFPELSLTGYPPEDLLLLESFNNEFTLVAETCASLFKNTTGIFGGIHYQNQRLYNSAFVATNGEINARFDKRLLPNYGVFDEKRYFTPGDTPLVITIKDQAILVSICEDFWEPKEWLNQAIIDNEVNGIVNISASPYHIDKKAQRLKLIHNIVNEHQVWFAYCNCVGGQDELVFDGNSLFISPEGETVYQGLSFEEDLTVITLNSSYSSDHTASTESSLEEEIYKALATGLRDYVTKNGFSKVVLGLSGGIDSALTAAIAADALGPENILGVTMPSEYSSSGSVDDSVKLANNFGIQIENIPIKNLYQNYQDLLTPFFGVEKSGLASENIQARIRGNIVMAFSNRFGYLALTTGNKSEVSVGYCTLYGDMAGGFSVLKDIPKTLVYRLSEYRNKKAGFDIIPRDTITKPPSAELRPDQKDSDSLPDYDTLDEILSLHVEKGESIDAIVQKGFDIETVQQVARLVRRSEFKRRQACPGVKITTRAYGKDRRFPITNRWNK